MGGVSVEQAIRVEQMIRVDASQPLDASTVSSSSSAQLNAAARFVFISGVHLLLHGSLHTTHGMSPSQLVPTQGGLTHALHECNQQVWRRAAGRSFAVLGTSKQWNVI